MTTKCQACKGKSQSYLCGKCVRQLRDDLADWPWWIARLEESVVGQVKLGDGGRRSVWTMHGDGELASHIGTLPGCRCEDECTCNLNVARGKRHRAALAQALALGRVNANASEVHDDARNVLSTWVRHLAESRGVTLVHNPRFIGPLRPNEVRAPWPNNVGYAQWLRVNVSAIASDEAAGEFVDELTDLRKRIERAVNRPQPRKFLGHCPTWLEDDKRACGRELYAQAEAVEVRCRDCGETHNCNRLQLLQRGDLERERLTWDRILKANRLQPDGYRIPERTLRSWRSIGPNGEPPALKPRDWLRTDGSRGPRQGDDDEPLYLWRDVQALHTRKPQGVATGAAAHRKAARAG